VARLLVWIGVIERAPRAPSALISVVHVGGHLGRQALDEHDLGVTCRNLGEDVNVGHVGHVRTFVRRNAGSAGCAGRQSRDC
jgi:hypothetical protein